MIHVARGGRDLSIPVSIPEHRDSVDGRLDVDSTSLNFRRRAGPVITGDPVGIVITSPGWPSGLHYHLSLSEWGQARCTSWGGWECGTEAERGGSDRPASHIFYIFAPSRFSSLMKLSKPKSHLFPWCKVG